MASALVAATLASYCGVFQNGFVDLDDQDYIVRNPRLHEGLTWQTIAWSFTSFDMSNWHPLTWLSWALDARLFGLNPAAFHATNLFWHAANTVLLFFLLRGGTGCSVRSAVVAALFALHPLHVESVAWISERKDVLSTFFAFLGLLVYTRYAAKPSPGRMLLVTVCLALSLLAKPMFVTFPLLALLWDFWPLRRFESNSAPLRRIASLVLEKLPLFALCTASTAVTFMAQRAAGSTAPLSTVSVGERLANAALAYVGYLGKTFWPGKLSAFYPLPTNAPPLWQTAVAIGLLVVATFAACRAGRRAPYLATGWLWYLVSLLPVIGIVQIGTQSMADRYTYIPTVGIFMLTAWAIADLVSTWPAAGKAAVTALTLMLLCACGVATFRQVRHWHDATSLWQHAVDVMPDNYRAKSHLAQYCLERGETSEARRLAESALADRPTAYAHLVLAAIDFRERKFSPATDHFEQALQLESACWGEAENGLGAVLASQGDFAGAERHFRRALSLTPYSATAHNNLGLALLHQDRFEEAVAWFQGAVRLDPGFAAAHENLALLAAIEERWTDGLPPCAAMVEIDPKEPRYRQLLACTLWEAGDRQESKRQYALAESLAPDWRQRASKKAEELLASSPATLFASRKALVLAKQVCQAADPTPAAADLELLARAYQATGRVDKAKAAAERALKVAEASGKTDLAGDLRARLQALDEK